MGYMRGLGYTALTALHPHYSQNAQSVKSAEEILCLS